MIIQQLRPGVLKTKPAPLGQDGLGHLCRRCSGSRDIGRLDVAILGSFGVGFLEFGVHERVEAVSRAVEPLLLALVVVFSL